MQAIVEMLAAVVIWMAVATLNHLGVQVEMPPPESKAERVIHRDSARTEEKAAVQAAPCPQTLTPEARPATIDA
jgi:hypothetical protein